MPGGWGSWNLIGWLIISIGFTVLLAFGWVWLLCWVQERATRWQTERRKAQQNTDCIYGKHVQPLIDAVEEVGYYNHAQHTGRQSRRRRIVSTCRNCKAPVRTTAWMEV